MVKSSSCLRLITCGGGAAEKNDYQPVSEIKDSNDKSGWSFRKRSARHRVLSNTVITETPSSANKETSECKSINFQPLEPKETSECTSINVQPQEPNVAEKNNTTNFSDEKPQLTSNVAEKNNTTDFSDEKPQLTSIERSELSETIVTETECKVDVSVPESVVIILQAAIRGFLAQRALLKSKNVVKLQAAFRGHLERRHAVGTLRCVQAIVKMQLLVRARHAQQSHSDVHLNHKDGKNDSKSARDQHVTKSNVTNTSIEKLVKNRFARQLLESTPKKKPIHVKCDPSKADSAWKWLERWMTVSSKDSAENKKPISMSEQSVETKDSTPTSQQLETSLPSEVFLQLADSKPTVGDSPLPHEDEENTATYDANDFNFQTSLSVPSLVKDNLEQAPPEKIFTDDVKVTSTEIDSLQNEKKESDASVLQEPSSPPLKPEIDGEQCKQSMETFVSDPQETEGKKLVHGSRKFSNPAFIAAQSKFEELSSMANSGKSSSLSNQNASVESPADTSSVVTDSAYQSKEFFSTKNSASGVSGVGGSECGTELSITSTLDSPDRLEVETMENQHDAKDLVKGIGSPENKMDHVVEDNILCDTPTSNLPISDLNKIEPVYAAGGDMVDTVVVGNSKETAVEPEKNSSELSRDQQTETVLQDFKLSPKASPGSHVTISESQETPSSQVSVKSKGSKTDKSGSSNRRRKLSVGNKSPANANHDSGSRGSREPLPKDQQNGKRRNSLGSVKPDHVDQEPRDNSSNNNSVPRFMLATESAKAKISANYSPRSSPDVHEQDIHVKKRHSLPGATGKQGSPRVQHSPAEAQQGTKGNGIHNLHERKWLR